MEILSRYFPSFALDIVRLCVWLVILMIIFVPLEKLCAVYPRKVFRRAFGTDVAYYFLSGLLPRLLLVLPMNLVAGIIHRAQPLGLYSWVADLPLWIRLVAAFVVGEAGSYWGHRWSHEIPCLWRFHAIHHSAEEIDWLVNTRAHPVDMVFTRMCGLIPMYLLGLAQPRANTVDLVPVLVTIAGTIWGFFLHANVSWRFGWLKWLVSSPAFHHWHHTNDGADPINENFAGMLPWLDKCFGTFYLPAKEWPMRYGIDTGMTRNFTAQILQPFIPRAGARQN